jgi:nucleoid DNA-binding protein
MKKSDLIRKIARENGGDPGDAADGMDRAVTQILHTLRRGRPARLPGLGTITPGKQWTFRAEVEEKL